MDDEDERLMGSSPPTSIAIPSEVGIIKELSAFKTLQRIKENLLGRFWNDETKQFEGIKGFKPLMNEFGVNKYLAVLSSFLVDIVTMSNLPAEEINVICLHICENTIPSMYANHAEWGIKNKSDLPILANQIFIMSYGALHKGRGAGDRNVIRGTLTENIVQRGIPMYQQEEKKGFLSRINPFAR